MHVVVFAPEKMAMIFFKVEFPTGDMTVKVHTHTHIHTLPDRIAQSVAHLTQEPEVPGSILGPATYFRFSFHLFKKGRCQLLAKVRARRF